jgi:hypothetical protein
MFQSENKESMKMRENFNYKILKSTQIIENFNVDLLLKTEFDG